MLSVTPERVMIVAGESSGELYGAYLARALRSLAPKLHMIGIGGDRMRDASVDLICPIVSSFGVVEAFRTYGAIRRTFKEAVNAINRFRPQVVVVIDYPDFNIRLARQAKARGIPVLYFVSPQIWAWRKKRLRTISMVADQMAVILPFEEELYHAAGLPVQFVGHPVMDEIREVIAEEGFDDSALGSAELKVAMRKRLDLDPDRPVCVVMPGSRRHEIERLFTLFSDAMKFLSRRHTTLQFVVPRAPNIDRGIFGSVPLPPACRFIEGRSIECLAASDTGIIASGTSTLQAALMGVPQVVAYKLSAVSYFLGKRLVTVPYISLANLLLEWSVDGDSGLRITELIQNDVTAERLAVEVEKLLVDGPLRTDMLDQCRRIRTLFAGLHASERTAALAADLAVGECR